MHKRFNNIEELEGTLREINFKPTQIDNKLDQLMSDQEKKSNLYKETYNAKT